MTEGDPPLAPADEAWGDSPDSGLPGGESPLARPKEAIESLSPKGLRTRQRLLEGARRAFEANGSYVETRINDIAKESGVAYGSFYTYFDSKEQLFYELAVEVVNEMYIEGTSRYRGRNPVDRIASANRQFLASYRDHSAMMTIIEQAASLLPELRGLRRRLRQVFVDRIAANLQRWSELGRIDDSLDPLIAAHALVSMIDNFSYLWFVLGEDFDEEAAPATLTRLWANALAVATPPTEPDSAEAR